MTKGTQRKGAAAAASMPPSSASSSSCSSASSSLGLSGNSRRLSGNGGNNGRKIRNSNLNFKVFARVLPDRATDLSDAKSTPTPTTTQLTHAGLLQTLQHAYATAQLGVPANSVIAESTHLVLFDPLQPSRLRLVVPTAALKRHVKASRIPCALLSVVVGRTVACAKLLWHSVHQLADTGGNMQDCFGLEHTAQIPLRIGLTKAGGSGELMTDAAGIEFHIAHIAETEARTQGGGQKHRWTLPENRWRKEAFRTLAAYMRGDEAVDVTAVEATMGEDGVPIFPPLSDASTDAAVPKIVVTQPKKSSKGKVVQSVIVAQVGKSVKFDAGSKKAAAASKATANRQIRRVRKLRLQQPPRINPDAETDGEESDSDLHTCAAAEEEDHEGDDREDDEEEADEEDEPSMADAAPASWASSLSWDYVRPFDAVEAAVSTGLWSSSDGTHRISDQHQIAKGWASDRELGLPQMQMQTEAAAPSQSYSASAPSPYMHDDYLQNERMMDAYDA